MEFLESARANPAYLREVRWVTSWSKVDFSPHTFPDARRGQARGILLTNEPDKDSQFDDILEQRLDLCDLERISSVAPLCQPLFDTKIFSAK